MDALRFDLLFDNLYYNTLQQGEKQSIDFNTTAQIFKEVFVLTFLKASIF
jgi:hypothetical protein